MGHLHKQEGAPPQHTTVIVPAQTIDAPDYLAYSIFTMLCCCLPLGIAALVYSIQTQDANRMGNGAEAQRNSRKARILAHTALGLGILLVLGVTVMVVVSKN
ncbi:PREDICTED: synapse differentiation-inducing gene protein 1-like [Gekko japonicus]|uniref:Synapse differentiation-inducing gene protein 1-like n=1 Tax=Gekko japonicus TaxID=146911 RepID=A0ABM1KIP3_GEKJA|nr:PREDICTED: synapse differentiation-inducing gene protein 1-like [Gekko japonicus]